MCSAIVKVDTRPYRQIAQENWGLTDEQMKGMHVHHRIHQAQGGLNDAANLYVCSPWFHYNVWHYGEASIKAVALQERWRNGEFKTGFETATKEKQRERGLKGGASCRDNKVGVCAEGFGEKVSENMQSLVKSGKHWFQSEEHSKRVTASNKVPHECPICGKIIKGKGPLGVHMKSHRLQSNRKKQ